jgi:hypothetical protein
LPCSRSIRLNKLAMRWLNVRVPTRQGQVGQPSKVADSLRRSRCRNEGARARRMSTDFRSGGGLS